MSAYPLPPARARAGPSTPALREHAARVEAAAAGDVRGRRYLARDLEVAQEIGAAGLGLADRGDEGLRIGVEGMVDDLVLTADLHDPAEVHDRDPIGEEAGSRDVVGDIDERQLHVRLDALHQLEDLGTRGEVDHRDGLVGDDDARPEDESAGYRDALPLAAREHVRVPVEVVRDRDLSSLSPKPLRSCSSFAPASRRCDG